MPRRDLPGGGAAGGLTTYRIPRCREPWQICRADILDIACAIAGSTPSAVLGGERHGADCLARELVAVIGRRFRRVPMSWPEVGAVQRGSHSTGVEGWNRFQRRPYAEREELLFRLRCEACARRGETL